MKIWELITLAIGLVSSGLYARNFYYMVTGPGIALIEPNKVIASAEFIIAIIGTMGLSMMIWRHCHD